MLETIQANIAKHGHHIYLVAGGATPRFSYTIGLSPSAGIELVLAGSSYYSMEDVGRIINVIASEIASGKNWRGKKFEVDSLGYFSLREADASWVKLLMLGALDFYGVSEIASLQIVPDRAHWTVDVPDLSQPWSPKAEPVWQWLLESWEEVVRPESVAITNLDALRGERITEAGRWEEGEWELFAGPGPDVPEGEVRTVPLGTLLAVDESLRAVTRLEVGSALWRDSDELVWHPWGKTNETSTHNSVH